MHLISTAIQFEIMCGKRLMHACIPVWVAVGCCMQLQVQLPVDLLQVLGLLCLKQATPCEPTAWQLLQGAAALLLPL